VLERKTVDYQIFFDEFRFIGVPDSFYI